MWTPPSQNRTVTRCAHSRPCSSVPRGGSSSCCGCSARPRRDDAEETRRVTSVWLQAENDRFSIAASVKPRPDYLMLSPFCTSANERYTGLLLLFEVGAKPPHDAMRRMGRYNLSAD